MANSSSEDGTDTLLKRPTRMQPYHFEPVGQDFESTRTSCHIRSKPQFNPLSPHCGSIVWELMHCYTRGRLRIVAVHGNTVGRHS